MRVRFWARDASGVSLEGPPWITHVDNDEQEGIKLALSGESPSARQVRVVFTRDEWEIIKARGDAAFAGRDANQSAFHGCAEVME